MAVKPDVFPVVQEMNTTPKGDDLMQIKRRGQLTEPWLLLFGADYDAGRRYLFKAVVIHPLPWTGPLPE